MKKQKSVSTSAFFAARILTAIALGLSGVALATIAIQRTSLQRHPVANEEERSEAVRPMPVPDEDGEDESSKLNKLEQYWSDRLTYPTGNFNPAWVRAAAAQNETLSTELPEGNFERFNVALRKGGNPLALPTNTWTGLGPAPERMTGCTGCFDYTKTTGRVNQIAVDPTTTTNGSIVAYAATVGGGVWKTTNCCSAGTTWAVTTDDPLIATTAIDDLVIDPNDHNTIYAATGDLNYGSFSMGSVGILKSTDAGATWRVLGADVFGPEFPAPAGQFSQYNAVGKVRVDPNNSNIVVAGTKIGLYFSYDGGITWNGPFATNAFSSQRQDITGLELTNIGGVTRIVAAIGVRGFATTVQVGLGNNGANGVYIGNMPLEGDAPVFTAVSTNAKGWNFGTAVTGSPYTTGAALNGASGSPWVNTTTGNQLGRIDIAVAPSNPNVIYAQVQSIAPNNNGGCGNTNGCQLGAFVTNDGGNTWTFMPGSQGGALRQCANTGPANSATSAGDYPQNWYDQHVEVDPNDASKVWFDTHEIWFATMNGTTWYDTSCVYTQSTAVGVHADQHSLTFVPGSSNILIAGHDGGVVFASDTQTTALNTKRPTWINIDEGFNTIEFYAGDISGNFATAANPQAVGGAQDNGPSSIRFNGSPTGPAQWQMGLGGDGFSGQHQSIDSQATGLITLTGAAVAGETFTIGSQTFTFVAAAPANSTQVQVNASTTTQGNNIVTAINTTMPSVATSLRIGATVFVNATVPGAGGNSLAFTENATNFTMNGGGTLGGTQQGGIVDTGLFWQGNNSGGLQRCYINCTVGGATYQNRQGGWTGDQQSFVLPVNLFHGGIPGGDDCAPSGPSNGCGHMLAGTTRVWETITGSTLISTWYITNNPAGAAAGPNLTKGTLGNRSFINQVKYSPKYYSVAIVGTNDGNVQIGFNLGTGVANQANWVNVTGGNTVLPNRPVLGISLDPVVPAANVPVGYAAVGGFNANSPSTPGHVFQVTCAANCASFTWLNKTGNLPDIPVDSIISNPNNAKQVFAGTDWGVYFTNDITAATPVWNRFNVGFPHTMVWDLQIDRGSTTLSAWTRGRGAWVYPLPGVDIISPAPTLQAAASRMTHDASGTFDIPLALTGPATVEPRRNAAGNYTVVMTFSEAVNAGTATSSSGSPSVSFSGNNMIVALSGVADVQTVTVTANNIAGANTATTPSATVRVGILHGDVTGDRTVNSADAMVTRNHSGEIVNGLNFRYDVTLSGLINVGDSIVVRNKSGNTLIPPTMIDNGADKSSAK